MCFWEGDVVEPSDGPQRVYYIEACRILPRSCVSPRQTSNYLDYTSLTQCDDAKLVAASAGPAPLLEYLLQYVILLAPLCLLHTYYRS